MNSETPEMLNFRLAYEIPDYELLYEFICKIPAINLKSMELVHIIICQW